MICSEIPRAEFDSLLALFSEQAKLSDGTIDIGSYWCENGDSSLNALILLAKEEMHQNKSYRNHSGEESNAKNIDNIKCSCTFASATQGINGTIKKYLSENYFDLERFLKSTSLASYYPFFGDMQTGVFYISDPIKEAFGFSKNIIKDLISKWERIITRREDLELYRNDLQDIIKNKRETHDIRYRIKDIHGREFWIRCCGIIQWDAEFEKPLFFSGGISKVDFEFIIDPATNFQREHGAMLEIQELQKHKEAVSFIGFKLNGFKEINDLNGRTVANSILKNIADNLLAIFDGKMQFFRLDGLKFMAIPSADYKEDVQYIIHTIKREIEKVYKEHKIIIKNPCSLCVVNEGWIDSLPSAVISDVLGLLDFAKDHPAEEYALHSLENIKAQRNKSRMIVELNDAVLHDFRDFRIVIQPIVSAKDFKIVGGEVLLRWKYNDKDISPMTFVPILERNQQIIAVGRWVAEQTIVNCRRAMSYMPNFRLNFNVSYHQISDIGFLYFVDECMKQWELKSSHIVMEITETNQNENPKMLQEFIHSCKDMGINVALDDFGTGYSSLELLLRYPSDIIKIDRVLMREMAVSKDTSDFIAGIVHSCHKFGKSVCVEGVESDHELATVIEAQCDTIQGYYFYKPMELPDFYGLLAEQSRG
ncbi:MAG: sensor domain-containing phosphodiesterase [Wolinella sp.]